MNVLLITEAFPPAPVVGSFRAAKVARAFRDLGHHVHVITMAGGAASDEAGLFEDGISGQRVSPWPGPRQAYLKLRARLPRPSRGSSRGMDGAPATAGDGSAGAPAGGRMRDIIAGLMTLPDDRQGFVPAVMGAAWSRRNAVDLIYSTAPCFSAHVAARAVHMLIRVPWYAELRDPWVGNAARDRYATTPVVGTLDRWLERRCLRAANGIVTVTPAAAAEYRRRYAGTGPEVICALNGIDVIGASERPRREGGLRVVYAGSLYPPRNPAPLVRALHRVHARMCPGQAVTLAFVGSGGWEEADGLQEAVQDLPDQFTVERHGWLSQDEARRLMHEADLLLLPAQEWRLQIPNKLFDYLGSRVPVLGIVDRGSDVASMLAEAGGHHFAYSDDGPSELDRAAAAALRHASNGARAGSVDVLSRWTTQSQISGMVRDIARRHE